MPACECRPFTVALGHDVRGATSPDQLHGSTQANFHTSSTHTPTIDTYKTRHVGSTASVTKLIARSRSHGFPLSVRLNGLRPAGLVHNYTNTHATYSNAPWAWARLVPQCLVNLSRPPAVATTRPPGGLSWVISSPALTGAGANHPPVMGGQLTFDALVDYVRFMPFHAKVFISVTPLLS